MQTRLPIFNLNDTSLDKPNETSDIKVIEKSKLNSPNISQNKMVRTDSSEQKIDKFLNTSNSMLMLPKSETDNTIKR